MSSFRFQLKDKHPQNILKDTRKLLGDKTNVHLGNVSKRNEGQNNHLIESDK